MSRTRSAAGGVYEDEETKGETDSDLGNDANAPSDGSDQVLYGMANRDSGSMDLTAMSEAVLDRMKSMISR